MGRGRGGVHRPQARQGRGASWACVCIAGSSHRAWRREEGGNSSQSPQSPCVRDVAGLLAVVALLLGTHRSARLSTSVFSYIGQVTS